MLEGYITPLLTSYLSKYIKNIKPSDLKLSFWGGDAVLTNLQLKLEAIEESFRSLGLPFELKSGSVKQLTLHIPWTAIGSEPIIASFDSVECTIKLHNFYQTRSLSSPRAIKEKATPTETTPSETTPSQSPPDPQQTGTAPGYISGLLNRITNNVKLRVTNCLLKIIEEHCDLQFSISIKEAEFMTTNSSWQHEFIYTDHLVSSDEYSLHRICQVTGATICLDVIGGCGQVEEYDEPFLDGCVFECRWKIGYRDKAVIENRFEILTRDLEFSVSENQFVLFIHYLDWLMGLYYSMKKLRGRDDVSYEKQKEETKEEDNDAALEREISPSRVEDKEKREDPSLEGSSDPGWGSWLMSFVAPDEGGRDDVQATPLTPPSLSLGFYAKSIKIDFRVSTFKKQRPSVFLSQMRKGSWFRVVSLRFSGCMSRVDRIPSLKHLGATVGIMSVNGWIGGEGVEGCTCGLVAMAGKKHKKSSGNEDKMIHVYSLGSTSPIDVQPLLNQSLFDESLHSPPPPRHWLLYKQEYQGFWFTYDYYDSGPPERETETCQETLKLGKHSLILSLDVMHRLDFFINKFRVSLEATPLVSQGLIVLGDPVAKTMLSIASDTTLIHLPLKCHISSHDSKPTIPTTSLVINRISAEVTMAMYSGNATPTDPQTLHIDCNIEELIFSSVECSNDSISHVTGILVTDQSVLCPQLSLSVHNKTDGSLQSSYYHFEAPEVRTDVTFRNLCLLFTIAASWLSSTSSLPPPPLPAASERDATDRLILLLRGITGEYSKSISEGTLVSCCLGEVLVHFISSLSSTVPIIQSPAPIGSCIKSLADNTVHDIGSNVSSSVDERVFEVCLVWPREEGVPLLGLKVGGIAIYLPHSLLAQFEEYAKQLLEIWCIFKDDQEENRTIPAFTPVGHATQPPHSFPSHIDSPVLSSFQEEDEDGEETEKTRTAQLLSILESYKLDISCEHILFMLLFEPLKTPLPATPLSCLSASISDEGQRMILFGFPRLKVEMSYSSAPPHHHVLANIDQPSLKVSLTNALISAIINTQVTHILNPLSVNVSLALIQSPSVIGVVCIGIHADVKILQITMDKQKVKLLCQVLNILQSFLSIYSPPPRSPPSFHPLVSDVSFNKLPSSAASSSHSFPPPPPPPFSDVSSTSLISLYGSNPSLWLQLTLGKLVVGVSDSKPTSSTMYLAEADEISFSLDVQERISSYQLKLSSLEANSSSSSAHYSSSFTKLFSSSSSVVTATVAKEIESQLGSVNGECNISFPVSPPSPATLPSFLLLEIASPHKYESSSLPTKVKLHVQMFEGVLWLPLVGAILDILEELNDNIYNNHGTGEKIEETNSKLAITAHDNQWPLLDVKFNNFNVFIQSDSTSRSLLVLASEGLCVSSSLDFPVSRLIVNHSAMRRLEIAVHEKRVPPLPGYQLMVYSAQLIGIRREHDSIKLESFSLSYASDIRILYSPSLKHHSKGQFLTDDKSVVATGDLLELHFDSKVFLFCGKDQVDCLLDVCNGMTHLIQNRFNKHAQLAVEPVKQEKETCFHYQILVTGKALSLRLFSFKQEIRKELKEVEFSLLIFNPTLMINSIEQSLNIDLSIFNVLASYHGSNEEACQVIETCEGSISEENGLRSGLLQIKINKQNKGIILSCIMSRSLRVTFTPSLLLLILNSIQIINNFTSQIKSERGEVAMSETKRAEPPGSIELKSVSLSLVTKQVIIIIGGTGSGVVKGSGDDAKGSGDFAKGSGDDAKVSGDDAKGSGDYAKGSGDFAKGPNNDDFVLVWDSLSIAVPPNKTIEGSSQAPVDVGSGNIDVIQAQISLEGIELFVFINGHKSLIIPYCILTSLITYWIPLSLYDSGRLEFSVVSDWVQMMLCMAHALSANKLIKDYNMIVGEQLLLRQKDGNNQFVELNKERDRNSMTENDDSCLRDEIRSHDDLRSGSDLILITDPTDILILPAPGEVRFYEGESGSPPAMMWCYKESRKLCSVSILPVPLTVMGEEDWPVDIKVVCELSYYSLISNDWVYLDTLQLSEVSPAGVLLSHKGMESSNKWRLTLPALEWADGDNDIQRLELPLTELQTGGVTAVLSPLVLAGCTAVDSVIRTSDSYIIPTSVNVHIKSLECTLRREPLTDMRNTSHALSSYVDNFPLDLFQFKSKDFTIETTLVEVTRRMHVKFSGLVSLKYTDIRDLLWRDALFPTDLTINSITRPLKQFDRLKETKVSITTPAPTVIRVSPSLLYTISMTTNAILMERSHYATGKEPNGGRNDKQPLGVYIIRNKSLIDLVIGQMGTVERVSLPGDSCCSYNWRSFNNEKKLRISYGIDGRWSNGFTIDAIGIHQVVMDDGLCLIVQVKCNGSIQKLVTISGGLTISSRIQEQILLIYSTALDPGLASLHQSKSIDIGSQSKLEGVVWYDIRESGLSFQFKETDQSHGPLFEIPLDSDLSFIQVGEENGESCSFWSSVKSVTESPALEVTLAPLFEICNYFPFEVQLVLLDEKGGGGGVGTIRTVPGGGSVTPLESTMTAGRLYSIQFNSFYPAEGGFTGSLIKLSTSLSNELPEFEHECIGLGLYKECTCTDDRKKLEKPSSIVSIPTHKGVMKGVMFLSKRKEGTIRIEVVPQVVLINETAYLIKRKGDDGLIVNLFCDELYPLSVNEVLTLVVSGGECDELFTAELSLKDYHQITPGQPPKTKRLTLTSSDPKQELVYKILVSFMMHNNTLMVVLKPIFTLFNQTGHCLSVHPSLGGTTSNSIVPAMSEGRRKEVAVPSNQSHSLLGWWSGIRTDAKLQLTFVVYVTANTEQPSEWSIPLSLNFVRRSFSLPTPSGPSPCLLTTHSDGCGQYYVVISHDPRPRLVCANHTGFTLHIIEFGSIGVHSCPQTLPSGYESYFEPPSLAKLYPTATNINNNSETNGDDENVVFKTLSDIHVQIGLLMSDTIEWSDPIPLHYDTEKYFKLSDTKLVFSTSYQYGALYISLLPGDGGILPVPIQTSSHCLISQETLHLLDIECFLGQLILSIDVEDTLKIRPILTCVFDNWSSKLSVSRGSQYQCTISIKSIQIDHHNSTNEPVLFPVLAIPRHDHVPPISIVEREVPPFLLFSVNWTKFSDNVGGTFITETCLSLQPLTLQFDDSFVHSLKKIMLAYSYSPLPVSDPSPSSPSLVHNVNDNQCKVPSYILEEANRDRYPLAINHLQIDGVLIYLSVCFTRGLSLSVDESRVLLSPLSHRHLYFNWSELAQSLASHYSLSLISQLDWILGSLDIIGSPGTLINTLQSGLKDFLSLPYQGLTRGPGFFILGLGQGTRSLLTGLLGGALRSVTNFASGMALNVERLSLDEDHVSYQEDLRRGGQRSLENLGAGFMVGVSSFGMSVMSAVAGLVEQPLHSIIVRQEQEETVATGGYTRSIVTGVGKGILGVVTKPVGGALQLVSQTGRGIIGMTGLHSTPVKKDMSVGEIEIITLQASLCRHLIVFLDVISNSVSQSFTIFHGLFKSLNQEYQSSLFCLTTDSLYVIDTNNSTLLHRFNITDYHCIIKKELGVKDEVVVTLNPVSFSLPLEIFESMPSPSDQTKPPGNCSPPPSNQKPGVTLNELHLGRLEVEIFISLFKSAQKILQEPQEYFIK